VENEVFGVHAHIQDVCVRLAKLGYFATALPPPGLALRGAQSGQSRGVAWYGGPLVGWTPAVSGNPAIRQWDGGYRPKDPIDVVADLKAPVLGLYGGAGPGKGRRRMAGSACSSGSSARRRLNRLT
jgi:hypothetical protein